MKSKQILSVLMALVMLLSMAACGVAPSANADGAAPAQSEAPAAAPEQAAAAATTIPEQAAAATAAPEQTAAPGQESAEATVASSPVASVAANASEIDAQLAVLYANLSKLVQAGGDQPWYYTVTDLDHDGSLEFIAAAQHPQDRSTNLKIWTLSKDRTTLTECSVSKDPDESFPDLMTDSADTYHDKNSDTWYYLFYDNVVLSDTDVYTSKSAFSLKNGTVSYDAYAVEHTLVANGKRQVSYTDMDGKDITAAEFISAGTGAFTGMERSNTSFDWFTREQATGLSRLVDSFMVFMGMKKATVAFPVPQPAAVQIPDSSPAPAPSPSPTPAPQPTYLTITKNPTNENKNVGGTAMFIANANVYDSLYWTMVSPYGGEYSTDTFGVMFPSSPVSGVYGTTLSVGNVSRDMSGWGAYCTFRYQGQTGRTSTAYIYVKDDPKPPTPATGTSYGSVTDWSYSTVTVYCSDIGTQWISWDIIDIDGDIYSGAPAAVNWTRSGSGVSVTWCHIDGDQPWVGPVQGSMSGNAYSGGGGYAINLQNGTQVFVDSWNCKVEGQFYEGCSAIVYYYNYPSNDNVYHADIYGNMGLIVPDQGGWAGSQYYNNEEDQGGWAGSQYYNNEEDQGGWAGANYYNDWDPTSNYVETDWGIMGTHENYNYDGSTYEAFWCPNCGGEVSLAMDTCPTCGLEFY